MRKRFLIIACVIFLNDVMLAQSHSGSPILPITVKTTVTAPTVMQAKDKLFWYKGKKINDSTLITPESNTIQYSKSRSLIIVQPKAKDPAATILNEVNKTEQRKNQLFAKLSAKPGNVVLYPAIELTLQEYDEIASDFNSFLKNTISLPSAIPSSTSGMKLGIYDVAIFSISRLTATDGVIPESVKNAYVELLNRKKNYPPLEFPAPPAREDGRCFDCDSTRQKNYQSEEGNWLEEFTRYEKDITQRSLAIQRTLQDLNIADDVAANEIMNGTRQAIEFAFARSENKVDFLIRKYGKDFTRLLSIVKAAISVERQKQITGVGKNTYGSTMTTLLELFNGIDKYLEQQMDARNYDFVLNIPFFIGLERQRQLLGDSSEAMEGVDNYLKKFYAFNRFRFEMQIDYTGSWEDCGIVRENFTAVNGLTDFVCLGFYGCKYRFFPHIEMANTAFNIHYGGWFGPELKITNGTTYEVISTDDDKCYTIPHNMQGLAVHPYMPIDAISFCENVQDSMAFSKLHLPGSHENRDDKRYGFWKFDHFDDEIQRDGFTESEAEQIYPDEQLMEELKAERETYEMQPSKQPNQDEMKKHYTNTMLTHQLRKKFFEIKEKPGEGVVFFDARNGSEIIVDGETTKTYTLKDDYVNEHAHIRIKIKVTHVPKDYKNIR